MCSLYCGSGGYTTVGGGGDVGGGVGCRTSLLPPPPQAVKARPTAIASSERFAPAGNAIPRLFPFIDMLPVPKSDFATYTASRPPRELQDPGSVMNASAPNRAVRDCRRAT